MPKLLQVSICRFLQSGVIILKMPQARERLQCVFLGLDISECSQERHINAQKTFRFSFQSAVGLKCAENQAQGVPSFSCVPQPLSLLST